MRSYWRWITARLVGATQPVRQYRDSAYQTYHTQLFASCSAGQASIEQRIAAETNHYLATAASIEAFLVWQRTIRSVRTKHRFKQTHSHAETLTWMRRRLSFRSHRTRVSTRRHSAWSVVAARVCACRVRPSLARACAQMRLAAASLRFHSTSSAYLARASR
eukprot:96651-Rhodomonas_salina.2